MPRTRVSVLEQALERAGEELASRDFCPTNEPGKWPPKGKNYCTEDGDFCPKCAEDWLIAQAAES